MLMSPLRISALLAAIGIGTASIGAAQAPVLPAPTPVPHILDTDPTLYCERLTLNGATGEVVERVVLTMRADSHEIAARETTAARTGEMQQRILYEYDGDGRLLGESWDEMGSSLFPDRQVSYEYDEAGQLARSTSAHVGAEPVVTVFEYDDSARLRSRTDDGCPDTFEYDDQGRLVEAIDREPMRGACEVVARTSYAYEMSMIPTRIDYRQPNGNGTFDSYQLLNFSGGGALTSRVRYRFGSGAEDVRIEFEYSETGELTQTTEIWAGSQTSTIKRFTYDCLGDAAQRK